MALDFQDTLVIIIQIVAIVLPTLGVYPYRIRTKNRNLIMHGFLGILAIVLNLVTIVWVMLPAFSYTISNLGEITLFTAATILLHAVLGSAAIVLGVIIIASWVTHPLSELSCSKTWRLMIPIYIILVLTLILGIVLPFL
jgi:hypothetical protein